MHIAYQPIVNLPHGEVVGLEALARFEGGEPPEEMFRLAGERGERVALEVEAIGMAVRNFPQKIGDAYLALNASVQTIIEMRGELTKDPGLQIPWPALVIEISERDKIENYQLLDETLSLLRQRRVRLAIDDLGVGFSGLERFTQINPDFLKIDKALIRNIGEHSLKKSVVRAVVTMARDSRSTVIAEGIETEEEMKWCTGLGVDCGQGYFFGRPEPFPAIS